MVLWGLKGLQYSSYSEGPLGDKRHKNILVVKVWGREYEGGDRC